MKKLLILFLFLFSCINFSCVSTYSAPLKILKIAIVYSQIDNYAWKNTFDHYLNEHKTDKYEANEFDVLADKINDYDIILLGVASNYYGQIDFNKNKEKIDSFLKNGGIVFISDANYKSAENWVNEFYGCEYLAGGPNIGGTVGEPFAQHHPILEDLDSQDIPPLGWGRVTKSKGMKTLFISTDNVPHLVYKEVGKGMVLISPSGIGWDLSDFLENVYYYTTNKTRLSYLNKEIKEPVWDFGENKKLSLSLVNGKDTAQTECKVSYDKEGITFSFLCYDSNKNNIVSDRKYIWQNDCVEVFLCPENNVYHFIADTKNSNYAEKDMNPDFNTYWTSKVRINDNNWTADIFIPYSSVGLNKDSHIKEIKFNIGRNYHPLKEDYGLYSFAVCPNLVLYEKEYFATGILNNLDLSKYVLTQPLEIITPEKIYVGENEFRVNCDREFQLTDADTGKIYNSANKKVKLNLDKTQKRLFATVKDGRTVLGTSPIINVNTENYISYDIIYPYYKSIVQSKDPQKMFKATVNTDRKDFDKYNLSYSLIKDKKNYYNKTIELKPEEKSDISFDIKDLKPGKYVCEFICQSPKGTVLDKVPYEFEVLKEAPFEVTFDEKHLCYVNGEPFFPIGLYHANGREIVQRNPDKKLPTESEAIKDIKSKNFNFAHSLFYIEPKDWKDYTDTGLIMCSEIGRTLDKKRIDNVIEEYNKQKTGLFYYTYDEPYGYLINEANEAYKYINSKDKHRPVIGAVCSYDVFRYANDAYDIFMPDIYKCGKGSLSYMVNPINEAKNACKNKKPIWVVPQAFGWGFENSPCSVPTKEELRCEAYLSVVKGATGLFWYAYVTGEEDKSNPYGIWYLPGSEIWNEFAKLNKEVSDFVPVLYKGISAGPLKTDNSKIYSNVWKTEDKTYAVLVNPENTPQIANLEKEINFKSYFKEYKYNIKGKKINFKPYECIIVEY